MTIRPVDLQVAVPRMAEADKSHKLQEQPQHNQTFANEVRQMLVRKQREVQRQDDVQHVKIRHQEKRDGQRRDRDQQQHPGANAGENDDGKAAASDGSRGRKLDIRI